MTDRLLSLNVYFYVTKTIFHWRDVQFIEEKDENLFINDGDTMEDESERTLKHREPVKHKSGPNPKSEGTESITAKKNYKRR